MSGYADAALVEHGLSGDETRFLHKPFTARALLEKAREFLDDPCPVLELARRNRAPAGAGRV
jgi:hypothetical protein